MRHGDRQRGEANETNEQNEDDENQESEEMEEDPERRYYRYLQSNLSEVSDPQEWMDVHNAEMSAEQLSMQQTESNAGDEEPENEL